MLNFQDPSQQILDDLQMSWPEHRLMYVAIAPMSIISPLTSFYTPPHPPWSGILQMDSHTRCPVSPGKTSQLLQSLLAHNLFTPRPIIACSPQHDPSWEGWALLWNVERVVMTHCNENECHLASGEVLLHSSRQEKLPFSDNREDSAVAYWTFR